MIKIIESAPKKVPGLSSLFVTFNYSPDIVAAIKQISGASYDKTTKQWEVPTTSMSRLLDILCKYDDIGLTVLPEYEHHESITYDLGSFKTKPFKYQEEGIQYGLNHDKFLLLDAPGLGKSLQIIYIAEKLKEIEGLEHCLIICGINTLKHNWKKEIERHSKLDCRILGERLTKKGTYKIGGIKERLEDLKNPIKEFFVIMNIETLRNSDIVDVLSKGKINKFDMIAFDEVHKCIRGDSIIQTDLGDIPISDIVNNNIKCKVKSYNETTQSIEYKDVVNHFKIPHNSNLLHLEFDDNGVIYSLDCTPDHKIYTHNRGYIPAIDLQESDDMEFLCTQ